MKTILPLAVGIIAGWFAFWELHIVDPTYRHAFETASDFALILSSAAFILGAFNLIQVNVPKIRRREADWQYKVVMLASALIMALAGAAWHKVGGVRSSGQVTTEIPETWGQNTVLPARINVHAANKRALVRIDEKIYRAWYSRDETNIWEPPGDRPLSLEVKPGVHTVEVFMAVAGFESYTYQAVASAGQAFDIRTDLLVRWGAKDGETGRAYTWLYDYVFAPCNATMFALLAFFIASAAFRAFRARNVESALLLGAAIFVMVGLVPIGGKISSFFPEFQEWIVAVPNTAGRRAIMMGAALGAVATGLRVILGLERSHLGAE